MPTWVNGSGQGVQVLEQAEGVGVVADRVDVAARHEDGGDPARAEPLADLGELGAVVDHPRREVGYDGVPVAASFSASSRVASSPLAARRGDGDGHVLGDVGDDLLLGARGGQDLVAGVGQQTLQRLVPDRRLVAHLATRFVIRTADDLRLPPRGRRPQDADRGLVARRSTPTGDLWHARTRRPGIPCTLRVHELPGRRLAAYTNSPVGGWRRTSKPRSASYQMRTRSSGSSQRPSPGLTSKASWNSARLRAMLARNSGGLCGSVVR